MEQIFKGILQMSAQSKGRSELQARVLEQGGCRLCACTRTLSEGIGVPLAHGMQGDQPCAIAHIVSWSVLVSAGFMINDRERSESEFMIY
eukprot:1156108-Pelagomonas_calceolata.AAC.10